MAKRTKEQQAHDREHLTTLLESSNGGCPKLWFTYIPTAGTTRHYRVFIVRKHALTNITAYVARVAGYRYNPNDNSLVVSGHGFSAEQDMTYATARTLNMPADTLAYEAI